MKAIVLIVFGLFGFWIVSYLMDLAKKKQQAGAGSSSQRASQDFQQEQQGQWQEESNNRQQSASSELEDACRSLGVSLPLSQEELKKAYRLRMAEYHPDKVNTLGAELRELAERKSKEINAAYELLKGFCR